MAGAFLSIRNLVPTIDQVAVKHHLEDRPARERRVGFLAMEDRRQRNARSGGRANSYSAERMAGGGSRNRAHPAADAGAHRDRARIARAIALARDAALF